MLCYMYCEVEEGLLVLFDVLCIECLVLIGYSDGGSIVFIFVGVFLDVLLGIVVMVLYEFVEEVMLVGICVVCLVWEMIDLLKKLVCYYYDQMQCVFSEWNDIWLLFVFCDWNIEDYLLKICCLVLVIQGEDDEYVMMCQIDVIVV